MLVVPLLFTALILSSSTRTETKYLCASELPDITLLRAVANGGNADAQYRIGMMNFGPQGDWHESAYWLRKAAEQGHVKAQLWLGTMYDQGHGVVRDNAEAARWYLRSARQGNPDAQFSLGQMYEEGDGVPEDLSQAAYWYRKAAEQVPDLGGAGQGRRALGRLYNEGRGVHQDYVEAYKWFALAMMSGDMADAAKHMSKKQITQAQHLAKVWVQAHPAKFPSCGE